MNRLEALKELAEKVEAGELPCPECGGDEISYGYSFPPYQGVVQCHADGCEIVAVAASERDALEKWAAGEWDYKVTSYTDDGQPLYTPRALIAQAED